MGSSDSKPINYDTGILVSEDVSSFLQKTCFIIPVFGYDDDEIIRFEVKENKVYFTESLDKIKEIHVCKHDNELTPKVQKWIVKYFPNIEEIYIFGNKITTFPRNLEDLSKLRRLWINCDKMFTDVNWAKGKFPSLERLYIKDEIRVLM